jgi:hypothetical protein
MYNMENNTNQTKNLKMANNKLSSDNINIQNITSTKENQMNEVINAEITTTELPTPKVIKTEETKRTTKTSSINLKELKIQEGYTSIERKSYTRINGNNRSIIIKGSTLEFDTIVENLDPRQVILTDEQRKKQHTGKSKMILKGIKDTNDLQFVMDRYFSAQ